MCDLHKCGGGGDVGWDGVLAIPGGGVDGGFGLPTSGIVAGGFGLPTSGIGV